MPSPSQGVMRLISSLGTYLAIALVGSGVIHVAVLAIDAFLVDGPVEIDLRRDFVGAAFSSLMLPVLAAYGVLCLLVYRLWDRARKAALATHTLELERAGEHAATATLQRTTGILVERLAAHNNRIGAWLERRRASGSAPPEVEEANRLIADTLRTLTELSFVDPLRGGAPMTPQEIEARLLQRLDETQPQIQTRAQPL